MKIMKKHATGKCDYCEIPEIIIIIIILTIIIITTIIIAGQTNPVLML